jgi:DNA-binding transcriptional ArsR family regulator
MLSLIEKQGSLNATQIIEKVHLSQPAVSHHLKILLEAKLIKADKKGKEVHYSIDKDTIADCCGSFMKKFS